MTPAVKPQPPTGRQKRNRTTKACHPCHTRKVRCDFGQPCRTCIRRHQPQLCNYGRTSGTTQGRLPRADDVVPKGTTPESFQAPAGSVRRTEQQSIANGAGLSSDDSSSPTVITLLEHIAANITASCGMDIDTGNKTFVGRRAHANYFRALLSHLPQQMLPLSASVEEIFGLTNRTISQPFVSLWKGTTELTLGTLLHSLPSVEDCIKYFHSYRQIDHDFCPIIHDIEAVERQLCTLLELLIAQAAESTSSSMQLAEKLSQDALVEYALLFAVLASGCQSCLVAGVDDSLALTARVLVACSYNCLSLANLYVSPSTGTIQVMLILANVSCNDGNPGVASGLLGLAAQQAQGLGLHQWCRCFWSPSQCECLHNVQPLWRAILMLDSRLSMHFDRIPTAPLPASDRPLHQLSSNPRVNFQDCLFELYCLQSRWQSLAGRGVCGSNLDDTTDSYLKHVAQLGRIARNDNLSEGRLKTTIQATVEQLIFTIHLDFFGGTLHLHSAVAMTSTTESRVHHFQQMVSNLCSVMNAYLKLRRLSPIAMLAWEICRAFKSSAILLTTLEVILQDDLTRNSLHEVAEHFSNSADYYTWRDNPLRSSCHAGVETLRRLVTLRNSMHSLIHNGC